MRHGSSIRIGAAGGELLGCLGSPVFREILPVNPEPKRNFKLLAVVVVSLGGSACYALYTGAVRHRNAPLWVFLAVAAFAVLLIGIPILLVAVWSRSARKRTARMLAELSPPERLRWAVTKRRQDAITIWLLLALLLAVFWRVQQSRP